MAITTTPRDAILDIMSILGWDTESSGDSDAPTGFFARITNGINDIPMIYSEFGGVIDSLDLDIYELVGHFLLTYDSNGYLHVETVATEQALVELFDLAQAEFNQWYDQVEEAYA